MGFRNGYRGAAERGEIHAFQCLDADSGGAGGELSVLHHRTERGRRRRAGRPAGQAGGHRLVAADHSDADDLCGHCGAGEGRVQGRGAGKPVFLANIREVDAIAHVLRCFEDGDITHVEGRVDPVADAPRSRRADAGLPESVERRLANLSRKIKGGDKEALDQHRLLEAAKAVLEEGRPARVVQVAEEDKRTWRLLQLLTSKPVLYVCNVDEGSAAEGNEFSAKVAAMAAAEGNAHVVISARIEEEIAQLDPEEQAMFLEEMGLHEAGLDRLIRAGYKLLHLQTISPWGQRRRGPGRSPRGRWHRRRRA